jgi:hypothetical protein
MPGAHPAPGIEGNFTICPIGLAAARRVIAKAFILAKENYRTSV